MKEHHDGSDNDIADQSIIQEPSIARQRAMRQALTEID